MADKPAAEKTEQPTPRKLSKARQEGQVAQSQELVSAVTLMVLILSVTFMGRPLLAWFESCVESSVSEPIDAFRDAGAFASYMNAQIIDAVVLILPILIVLSLAAIATSLAVGGFVLSTKSIEFKLDSINPSSVIQKLFSARSAVRLLMSIVKLLLVGLIAWYYIQSKLEMLAAIRWAWSLQILTTICQIIFGLCLRTGIAIIILGLVDAYYQKWQHTKDLKMTKQEVRQERKDEQGSPEIKSRIRRIQLQMSRKRLTETVPKASVVLVNPTHVACALQYDPKAMAAPILLVKGADEQAQRIMQIARSHGIPIVRRPEAARAIYATVKPGQPIPESLYIVVAEVLAMIYRIRQKKKAMRRQDNPTL